MNGINGNNLCNRIFCITNIRIIKPVNRFSDILSEIFSDRVIRLFVPRHENGGKHGVKPSGMNCRHSAVFRHDILRHGKIGAVQAVLRIVVLSVRAFRAIICRMYVQIQIFLKPVRNTYKRTLRRQSRTITKRITAVCIAHGDCICLQTVCNG